MQLLGLGQDLQEALSIPVIVKYPTPFVAPDRDMINRSLKLNPKRPGHVSDSNVDARRLSIPPPLPLFPPTASYRLTLTFILMPDPAAPAARRSYGAFLPPYF